MLIPPLFGLLLSDQLGGSQRVSQQLTDISGLLMSIFNSCRAGTLPKVQTSINIWRDLIVRKLWIGLIYLPHLTQAFCAVVELWCSHTHAPVQLLQQEATYTLHHLKIREINQDLWGYWNTLRYMHASAKSLDFFHTSPLHPCDTARPPSAGTSSLKRLCHWHHVVYWNESCSTELGAIMQQIRTITPLI